MYSSLFKYLCSIPVSDWLRPNSIWKADFAVLWNAFRSWHRFQVSWVFWIELMWTSWTALRRPSHSFRNVIRQVDPNSATLSIQSKLQCYSNAFQAHALLMHYACITHAFNRTLSKVVCCNNFWQVLPCLRRLFSSSFRTFLIFRNFGWIHLLQQSLSS